ncbi:MAG: EAL domain-containing protein [Alphaproteobacteria bacterium]|nr:EAL domain-containing protein [Alphaproteobacteria bacterium]
MSGDERTPPNYLNTLKTFAISQFTSTPPMSGAKKLWETVVNGAFDNNKPDFEPVLDRNGKAIFYESLSRPMDDEGIHQKIFPLVNAFYRSGAHNDLDLCTCTTALMNAVQQNKKPISLNISVVSALNPDFFDTMESHIESHNLKPEDVVFEILEHGVNPKADINHLRALKDKGYRFALDDFGVGQDHKNRLHAFGDIIDYIKIDGPYIRDYLEQEACGIAYPNTDKNQLFDILVTIDKHFGNTKSISLIAEHVHTDQEIPILDELGFIGYQGEFSKEHSPVRVLNESLANEFSTCDHE